MFEDKREHGICNCHQRESWHYNPDRSLCTSFFINGCNQ
ncbi:MAG: BPTI/Kunitz-type proteinase inhibitor domain-containing protein [Fibrobacterota bacterium]